MVRHLRPILLLVMACLGSAALAQTPTRDHPFPVVFDARHWGPFRVDPKFTLDNFGYDGNVYMAPTGAPQTTDVFLRLGPDVQAQTSFGPRLMLTLHDKLVYEAWASNTNLNHFDNMFEGQFDVMLGPVLLTTEGRWAQNTWRPTSEFTERVHEEDVSLRQTARLFIGPFTDVGLYAGRNTYKYSNSLQQYEVSDENGNAICCVTISTALDREREDVGGEIGWRPRPRTRLYVEAVRRTSRFDDPTYNRDSREFRRLLGVEFSPSSRLSGKLAFGRTKLESVDPESPRQPYDGSIAETELVYRPSGRTRLTAAVRRDLYFSTYKNNLYYTEIYRSLADETFIGSFWGFQFGFARIDNSYPETNELRPGYFDQRQDKITDYYAGLVFRLRGGFQVGLRVGKRLRESNDPAYRNDQGYVATSGSYIF